MPPDEDRLRRPELPGACRRAREPRARGAAALLQAAERDRAAGDAIEYPPWSGLLHFEAELAVVIGERCRGVAAAEAGRFILGYTCFNDVTARDLQARDNQWGRAKGFDGSACLGPWIETELDADSVAVRSFLNSSS